jgi:DDE_Tnp_1-associated
MELTIPGFIDFFKEVSDHRIERGKLYVVEEILLVAFCGIIAGCDSWDDLEMFGKSKIDYLRKYLPYNNGSPSDDTLNNLRVVL